MIFYKPSKKSLLEKHSLIKNRTYKFRITNKLVKKNIFQVLNPTVTFKKIIYVKSFKIVFFSNQTKITY